MKNTSIVENCRSILRERYCHQRSCNQSGRSAPIPQQGYPPCHPIITNPLHSLYGADNLRVPTVCCDEPSYCNTLYGLSPSIASRNYIRYPNCFDRNIGSIQSIRNKQTNCVPLSTTPSENCIQLIMNSIICKVRCKIPQNEVALLCCCLPSLIRQMMCKSPWLTPSDIIQWLSADIIKESMGCFDRTALNNENGFPQSKQDHQSNERTRNDREDEDNRSMRSDADDNDSLSSHRNAPSERSGLSKRLSKSMLDIFKKFKRKKKDKQKKNQSRTGSFTSQKSTNLPSDSHHSDISPSWSADDQSRKSDRHNLEGDARSFTSRDKDSHLPTNSIDSNGEYDRKSLDKSESIRPSAHPHLEYPGKKDPNATRDVEKCLAFYEKMREYFDDDVAAMLLKCCLCYGDCSGRK